MDNTNTATSTSTKQKPLGCNIFTDDDVKWHKTQLLNTQLLH